MYLRNKMKENENHDNSNLVNRIENHNLNDQNYRLKEDKNLLNKTLKNTMGKKMNVDDDDSIDSDVKLFENDKIDVANIEKKVQEEEINNDELLSEISKDSQNDFENVDKDILYIRYVEVKRVKTKWKCKFEDGILFKNNNKEILIKKLDGELERDW